MKKTCTLFLAAIMFLSSTAGAAEFSPLSVNSKIPGLRQPLSGVTFTNSSRMLGNLISAFGRRVGLKPGEKLADDEVQCALAKIGAMFVKNLMLGEIPGLKSSDVEGFPEALAHYQAREAYFCPKPPPPGVTSNRGAELMKLWTVRVMDESSKARQKELAATYTARAADLGYSVTPRDVAMAVAIGLAILAGELAPVPL